MANLRDHLQPDEEITYTARPTQLTLVAPLLATLAILISAFVIWVQTAEIFILLIGAILAGIGLIYLLLQFIVLKSNLYVVTTRRIIKQTGIFSKRSVDTYLDKINNVDHYQSLWGRLLNYGHIEIDTASESGTTPFPMISKPLQFKQVVLANAQRYRTGPVGFAAAASSGADRLRQLKALLDDGLINQAEFDEKRKKLIEDL